jgi:coproporphyrinogen III oxidase-like Fe-S oxidoreductase
VRYIELVEGGASAVEETDHLGPREDWMESLTSGLRTREGVSLATLDERTGAQTQRWCSGILEDLRGKGLVHADSERLRLTHDGLWVLDSILVKLFEAWPRG